MVESLNSLVFTLAKIENLMQQVTFDPISGHGRIITNTSLVPSGQVGETLEVFRDVISSGLAVCPLIKVEGIGEFARIHTPCSMTIDGVLLKHGVPIRPKGGGLVEVVGREPRRFTDMLMYWATTIDPIDILISQELTGISEMMRTGDGRILGNLSEAPMLARERIEELLDLLLNAEFSGVLELGEPNMNVLGVSVELDHLGIALVGGTNLAAAAMENGLDIETESISGLTDVKDMKHIEEFL
jgi:repressor of nif and glnA expression